MKYFVFSCFTRKVLRCKGLKLSFIDQRYIYHAKFFNFVVKFQSETAEIDSSNLDSTKNREKNGGMGKVGRKFGDNV